MDQKITMTQEKPTTVCFVAGRSGGHLIPALTLAEELIAKNADQKILFFCSNTELDNKIMKEGADLGQQIVLDLENVPRNKPSQYPRFIWHFLKACWKSFIHLREKKPSKVISTGGYIAIPVCLAARLLRIPIELFELNAVPGETTNFLAPYATTILHCFDEAKRLLPAEKCTLANYPLRFTPDAKKINRQFARRKLGLDPFKKTILILGGSQGSVFINQRIKEAIEKNPATFKDHQIIHQTGDYDFTDWVSWYEKKKISAYFFTYNHEIEYAYAATTIVICRSGAGTLFETLFFGKRCITIPLETETNSHQVDNAYALSMTHPYFMTVLRQDDLLKNPLLLSSTIEKLLDRDEI